MFADLTLQGRLFQTDGNECLLSLIQAAMDSRANDNLTVSLADGDSDYAYPIASYTYLLLYRTTMTNCDSAKELVR